MDYITLLFHLGVLIPMIYFIWRDGYKKGLKDAVSRIKQ